MCRGRPAAITEKIREIDRPPRCFPEDESQRSFPIRRNRLHSLLACTVSGTYPQVHSGGESGVDVGLSRNTAHLRMHLFGKGYGIDSNGGIQVWQRQGAFSQSRTAYYLKKTGEKKFLTVGAANRNTKDVFRERIARYVGDDPELAERIRLSSAIRSKTIQLLHDYDPTKY